MQDVLDVKTPEQKEPGSKQRYRKNIYYVHI